MTVTAADLERIVTGPGAKAYRARKLFELGCDRTDVVELLEMAYSQAHSIWTKEFAGGQQSQTATAQAEAAKAYVTRAVDSGRRQLRRVPEAPGGSWSSNAVQKALIQSSKRARLPLQLTPAQVRFLTQDGHVVVKIDKEAGAVCRNCNCKLAFSLRWLGFVHADSEAEPTDLEDRYE